MYCADLSQDPNDAADWYGHVRRLEKDVEQLRQDVKTCLSTLDSGLEADFGNVQKGFKSVEGIARRAASEATCQHPH